MSKEKDLFNDLFLEEYQKENTQPTNPANQFDKETESGQSVTPSAEAAKQLASQVAPITSAVIPPEPTAEEQEERLKVFGHHIVDFINTIYPNGAPVNTRHKSALKLAGDLMILLDGDEKLVKTVLTQISWVRDIIKERGEKEIDDIVDSSKKLLKKRESENVYEPRPSREMQRAIEEVVKRKYSVLVAEARAQRVGGNSSSHDDIVIVLDRIGRKLEKFFKYYPFLKLLCHGLKPKHYVAALFVGGGFAMTLCTRMWYRFWSEPGRKCRLNSIIELIGRSGSGKHIAVDLYKLLMEPIKKSDAVQVEALNNWNAERDQKSGADKNKTPRPKGIYRCMPSEASAAAIREAEFNAKEVVDGEEVCLHVSQFNSELDDLLTQQKKGYMNIEALLFKSLHNEPGGSFLKTASSMVGEYDVHFNGVYTGTSDAIAKQATAANFVKGLPQRLAAVPMGDSNFEMRENREYTEADQQREEQLREFAYKLDSTKGEIPCKNISDALHLWTSRRMADAKEEDSKALEDLVKRPCWIACNLVLPFVITRHWSEMVEDTDGRWKCGAGFKPDKIDVDLALTICDAQFAFQQYFFLSVGEQYYDNKAAEQASNVRHQQKTMLAYRRLPEYFTSEDVKREYGYDSVGSVCGRLKILVDDGMASQKIRSGENKGKYHKLL